jgi:anti-sigma regulatory factor (Ser/Thr protein kinase)
MFLRLTLDLPEDILYVRTTRLLSRALLQDINVVKDDIDDIESIVGELCSNVIRHAHSIKARFSVVIEYAERRAIILVEDEGTGFVTWLRQGRNAQGATGEHELGDMALLLWPVWRTSSPSASPTPMAPPFGSKSSCITAAFP